MRHWDKTQPTRSMVWKRLKCGCCVFNGVSFVLWIVNHFLTSWLVVVRHRLSKLGQGWGWFYCPGCHPLVVFPCFCGFCGGNKRDQWGYITGFDGFFWTQFDVPDLVPKRFQCGEEYCQQTEIAWLSSVCEFMLLTMCLSGGSFQVYFVESINIQSDFLRVHSVVKMYVTSSFSSCCRYLIIFILSV